MDEEGDNPLEEQDELTEDPVRDGKCNVQDIPMNELMTMDFEAIERQVTPRRLQKCKSNTLQISMKINYKLRQVAARKKGPDAERFQRLANSLEDFTYCLLDPLKINPVWCKEFGKNYLDGLLNDAIELKQKKFFTHPVVHSELSRKWHGRDLDKCKPWKLNFFTFWCIFDLVFSPILLGLFSLRKKTTEDEPLTIAKLYLVCLESPYYKFLRDTLSYIIMLFLHYALCLSPSTIAFSGLEWTILVFYVGRFLAELKQICCIRQWLRHPETEPLQCYCSRIFSVYCSDYWNIFDFASFVIYFIILMLRIVTWVNAGSVANNRVLVIAGYLYSFNTLLLTLRAFGQVMEHLKDVGTIQIALFSILKDVRTVLSQFLAVILAFSFAITKIYMSERSFIANESERHEIACNESGLSCWWAMLSQLGWSLLGRSEDSDPMTSVDPPSALLARIFYAAFLIVGVVLLINMLIALLSNTYRKIEENAVREWSFTKAIIIKTYDGYDPIPVPLNIIYRIYKIFRKESPSRQNNNDSIREFVKKLEAAYFAEHTNFFPISDGIERVLRVTKRNQQMICQVLFKTFASQDGDRRTPSDAWGEPAPGIRIEGQLLTFDCTKSHGHQLECHDHHGVRYLRAISPEFPYFEVTIVETGKFKTLGIGIVNEDYDISTMPGWEEDSVGYHTDDGNIFLGTMGRDHAINTKGPAMARQGDRIGCTALFEEKREADGKIPVFFTLNGREIILQGGENRGESRIFMDFMKPLFPFISMTEGSSVLAKMCTPVSEQVDHNGSRLDVLQKDMSKVFDQIMCVRQDVARQSLDFQESVKSDIAEIRHEMCTRENQMQKTMEGIVSNEVKKAMKCMEEKLDSLLVKLREKGN